MRLPVLGVELPTRTTLSVLGGTSLVGALALAFLPMPLTQFRPYVTVVASEATIFGLGLLAGVLGAVRLYGSRDESPTEPASLGVPEAANYGSVGATGSDLDDTIENVDGTLTEPRPSEWWQVRDRQTVEGEIRAVAIDVLTRTESCSIDEAAEMLESGTWTTDPRAASFLGGSEAPDPPLRLQFYDWLSGEAYDRHVEHTVDEIAKRDGLTEADAA